MMPCAALLYFRHKGEIGKHIGYDAPPVTSQPLQQAVVVWDAETPSLQYFFWTHKAAFDSGMFPGLVYAKQHGDFSKMVNGTPRSNGYPVNAVGGYIGRLVTKEELQQVYDAKKGYNDGDRFGSPSREARKTDLLSIGSKGRVITTSVARK